LVSVICDVLLDLLMSKNCFLFLLVILAIASCKNDSDVFIPDVSEVNVDFEVIRFEDKMQTRSIDQLLAEYPAFANTFFTSIIPVKRQPDYQAAMDTIMQNPRFQNLIDTTLLIHADLDKTMGELEKSFKYLHYYLPEIDIPDIYTFVSGFEYQRFLMADSGQNNLIGLGLDMFLGHTFPYASVSPENPAFSNYLTRTFDKEHLPRKVNELLLEDFLPKTEKNQMLDQMIFNGKKLYLLDHILPHTSDHIVMEYTPEQWTWAQENELEMWAFFLKENLFYENSSQKIKKYLSPSPSSPGMPPSAPGRTGNYIGWQIVKSYMKRHPETTIAELISLNKAQEFLQKSKYKPRK